LLGAVEDRTITLLAATTENPYFSVIAPLLSRCVLLTLHALTDDDVRALLDRAVRDPRGLAGSVVLADDAAEHLVRLAGGDVRKALTALEAAASAAHALKGTADVTNADPDGAEPAAQPPRIDLTTAEQAIDVAALRYDRAGDAHYDVVSAFIKSMRGSDPDAALHWLARMLSAGEDARFIARRMVIFASEDIGMADPVALTMATAAAHAVEYVGLPEVQLNLAHVVIYLATAPKSNTTTAALGAAMDDVRAGRGGAVPAHLRDSHYAGSRGLGHGVGYSYPHDDPRGVVQQRYLPEDIDDRVYYRPSRHGSEQPLSDRMAALRRIVRGGAADRGAAADREPTGDRGTVGGEEQHR